jgi:hypothetical protein
VFKKDQIRVGYSAKRSGRVGTELTWKLRLSVWFFSELELRTRAAAPSQRERSHWDYLIPPLHKRIPFAHTEQTREVIQLFSHASEPCS